jgi:hypothetical protein
MGEACAYNPGMARLLLGLAVVALTLAAWAGLGWLVVNVGPQEQPLAVPTFYLLAFVAVTCTGALVGWLLTRPGAQRGRLSSPAGFLGHAMLLAAISLFGIWLQSLRMLTTTVALLLIGLYVFLVLALIFGTRGTVDVSVPVRRPRPGESR